MTRRSDSGMYRTITMYADFTLPHKKYLLAVAGAALLFTSGLTHAAKTVYPLTIKNCGRDITFNKAPERVATVGQNSTEILYSLGLAERVVGTSLWFGPVPDAYKAANEKVAVIAQNIPSFEGIIAKKPDLVASQFEWQIGPAGTVASYEQFSELNVRHIPRLRTALKTTKTVATVYVKACLILLWFIRKSPIWRKFLTCRTKAMN